ncbi:hypothetical protein ANCDUO_16509, partial [Ancylostoma duodenale]
LCYTDSSFNQQEKYYKEVDHTLSSVMNGLTFQLQSGIHKRTLTIDSPEISLRDLRSEAYKFIQDIELFLSSCQKSGKEGKLHGVQPKALK